MLQRCQGKSKAATGDVVLGVFRAEFMLTLAGFRYISLWPRRNPKHQNIRKDTRKWKYLLYFQIFASVICPILRAVFFSDTCSQGSGAMELSSMFILYFFWNIFYLNVIFTAAPFDMGLQPIIMSDQDAKKPVEQEPPGEAPSKPFVYN